MAESRGRLISVHELPRADILGNPYPYTRMLMRYRGVGKRACSASCLEEFFSEDRLDDARGSHDKDAVLWVGVLYPPLLLQVPSYHPEVLHVDHVRPLHHPFLGHVRSRYSVGFHGGSLQDPTRRLPRSCPLLLVHEKTRRRWLAINIMR